MLINIFSEPLSYLCQPDYPQNMCYDSLWVNIKGEHYKNIENLIIFKYNLFSYMFVVVTQPEKSL